MKVSMMFPQNTPVCPSRLFRFAMDRDKLGIAERAKKRVDDLVSRSNILVLASHADALIREMCNRAACLHKGCIQAAGGVDEVIQEYHRFTGTHNVS